MIYRAWEDWVHQFSSDHLKEHNICQIYGSSSLTYCVCSCQYIQSITCYVHSCQGAFMFLKKRGNLSILTHNIKYLWNNFCLLEENFPFWNISFHFWDIKTFLLCKLGKWRCHYASCATKTAKQRIKNISRNIGAVLFNLGIRKVHHKRNKWNLLYKCHDISFAAGLLSVRNEFPVSVKNLMGEV